MDVKERNKTMRKLNSKAHTYIVCVVDDVMESAGVNGFDLFRNGDNPFVYPNCRSCRVA